MTVFQGSPGFDSLAGTSEADVLIGDFGNDTLEGMEGDDALYGGAGNDLLNGGPGSDTYYFGRGDGQDTVMSAGGAMGDQDKIQLGAGISLSDVSFSQDNADLILSFKQGNESLRIANYPGGPASPLIVFADGTQLDPMAVIGALSDYGTGHWGTMGADALIGGRGDDTLEGMEGDDALYGGAGNDLLNGGPGSDTYYFGRGDGQDTVMSAGGAMGDQDKILLGAGISLSDVSFSQDNADLILSFKQGNESLRIANYPGGPTSPLIVFADGTQLDPMAVIGALSDYGTGHWGTMGADALIGGRSDDTLEGMEGDDALYGGAGNDLLNGGPGSDTYYFGRGDGQDTVMSAGGAMGDQDKILLGAGISLSDVSFSQDNADLILSFKQGNESLRVANYPGGPTSPLIVFADGTQLDPMAVINNRQLFDNQVDALISAMAAFDPPAPGQTTLSVNSLAAFDLMIAAS